MNIAYHSSDLFAPVLGMSMASVFENNKDFDEITIYVIENQISEGNKERLRELADTYKRKVIFIPMPDINRAENLNLKKVKEKWIFDSYCRMFLDHLLPESVERVLYLDGDVLVVDSLKELWNLNLQGRSAAAVIDCFSEEYYRLFKFSANGRYYNSGVILFDLNLWHQQDMAGKIRQYIAENNGYVFFMEQTVFSYLMQGSLLSLPPKYNTYTMMQVLPYRDIYRLRKFSRYYTKEEIDDAVKDPAIVHLTTSFMVVNRAWNEVTNHPMREECRKYISLTPWGEEVLSKDSRPLSKKCIDFGVKVIPNSLLLPLISFVYNNLRVKNIERQMRKFYRY